MRSSVVLPAPFVPSKATASPGLTCREMPQSAGKLRVANGCRKARQPLRAGGKDFSRESMVIAKSGTLDFIARLWEENNVGGAECSAEGAWQEETIPGKIVGGHLKRIGEAVRTRQSGA